MSEKTQFDLERNGGIPENIAMREEGEPSHQAKLEMLYPRAVELVKASRSQIVEKVEELMKRYGSYERFPEGVAQDLADNVYGSGEVEMIEDIARAIQEIKVKA